MISKNKIKFIQSLNRKKTRDEHGVFLAEGNKLVEEAIISDFDIELLIATEQFVSVTNPNYSVIPDIIIASKEEIKKASLMQSPQEAIAVIKKKETFTHHINYKNQLVIALDCVQDPGNLGTILRIADWFGIKQIICSPDTADVYNPKVVQASMGAIFRIETFYTELEALIKKEKQSGTHIYGTFMDGNNIYQQQLINQGILIMGNEGNGISEKIEKLVTKKLSIPSFTENNSGSESLNVAIATAICCSEFKRRKT